MVVHRKYNPDYGDDRVCECGHAYYRHFDSYDNNAPVGCKYCSCFVFAEFTSEISQVELWLKKNRPDHYKSIISNSNPGDDNSELFLEQAYQFGYKP